MGGPAKTSWTGPLGILVSVAGFVVLLVTFLRGASFGTDRGGASSKGASAGSEAQMRAAFRSVMPTFPRLQQGSFV